MSDDSDSSDDDLLSATAFTQRRSKRKDTTKESKALKALDDILGKTEEKMMKQERMNELIEEGRRGFVPSKEDMELGVVGSGTVSPQESVIGKDGGGHEDSNSQARPTKKAKTSTNSKNEDASTEGDDNEDGPERSFPLRPISPSAIKSPPPKLPVPQKYDTKDPSYWSKIEKIVARSGEKSTTVAQRRKFILDKIDDCVDDSSDEYGYGNSGNNSDGGQRGINKEQKFAREQGEHSTLGMRRMLGWHVKEPSLSISNLSPCFSRFASSEDCNAELGIILNKYDGPTPRKLKSNEEASKQWESFRDNLVKPLKRKLAVDRKFLQNVLERKWPVQATIVTEDYLMWLIRLAISGKQFYDMYCNEAARMVTQIIHLGLPIVRFGEGKAENVDYLFQLKELTIMLESLFGLWAEGCDDRPLAQCSKENNGSNVNDGSFDNPYGLYNAMVIWAAVLEKDAVGKVDDAEEAKKDISKCIRMILSSGIDPIFYSGYNLLEPRAELIQLLLTSVQRDFFSAEGILSKDFLTWMGQSCNLALDMCCNRKLKPINIDESDNDKIHEFLTCDLILRSWQDIDQRNELFATFYYILSKHVLEKLLGDEIDFDQKSQNLSLNMKRSIDDDVTCTVEDVALRLKAIATVECIFSSVVGLDVSEQASMLLATVGIANHCEQIGIALFMINVLKKDIKSSTGICESESEAAVLYTHFDRLIGYCTDLKKTVKGVCNNLNMQRSVKLLSQLMTYYREGKTLTGRWGKCGEAKTKRQSNVSEYFTKTVKKDESDDDDSTL